MPRILGVDVPKTKKINIALRYLFGVGPSNSFDILRRAGIDPEKRTKDITDEELSKITNILQKEYKIEGDLKREISQNIKRLMDISTYRGLRHRRSLPVRGQRTKTNARTRKGPKKNVGLIRLVAKEEKPEKPEKT